VELEKIVKSILVSVQWDVWRFYLSAEQLIRQKVAVVSHVHLDHWLANLLEFDEVLVPEGIRVPEQFKNMNNIVYIDDFFRAEKLVFTHIGPRSLGRFLKLQLSTHSHWWLVRYMNCRVLFVGDVDQNDVPFVESFVAKTREMNRSINAVLLPSYGSAEAHGENIHDAIFELADRLRLSGVKIGALPHPIDAPWADYNAVRLQSLADISTFDIQKHEV